MDNLTLTRKARHLAKELLKKAKENEPPITADLQNIAREISAEMVGLENKFKSEISLIRKIADTAKASSQELWQAAERINDTLRYTFILPIESYTESPRQTIKHLRKADYQVPEYKIWNAWRTIGSDKDRGYRGINITIISSQKQRFELQFHTEASFELKTETHDLYKEARLTKTLPERRVEIKEIVLKKAAKVEIPKGVKQWNM